VYPKLINVATGKLLTVFDDPQTPCTTMVPLHSLSPSVVYEVLFLVLPHCGIALFPCFFHEVAARTHISPFYCREKERERALSVHMYRQCGFTKCVPIFRKDCTKSVSIPSLDCLCCLNWYLRDNVTAVVRVT
jgi:hypothetical protein